MQAKFANPPTAPEFNRLPDTIAVSIRRIRNAGVSSLVLGVCVPWSLLQTTIARRVFLAVAMLDIPLQIGTHLWFRPDAAQLGALGGLNVSITTISIAGLYAGWLPRVAVFRGMGPRPIIRFSKPLLVYLGSVIVSMLVARDPILSVFEVALFVQMFFLYVYIASTVVTKQDIRFLAGMLLFGLVAESLLMFMLLHGGSPPLAWALRPRVDLAKNPLDPSRVAGTIGSANSAAAYLGLSLLFAVSVLFSRMSPTLKILAGVGVVLGTFGLFSTFSRGGWLTTSICLALLLWLIAGATRKNLVKVLVVLALLGAIPLFFQDEISTRLAADDRGSAYSRIPLMKLASRMIEDHPILGVGSNNFGVTLDEYVTGDFRGGFLYAVHNQYLLIWTETGVVGLVSFVWFLTSSIGKGLRCWRVGDPVLSPLALGLSLGLVAFMLHMAVDIFRGRPLAQLVWVAAALISSIADVLGKPTPPTLSSAS